MDEEKTFKETIEAMCKKYDFNINRLYENELYYDFSITHIDKQGSRITIERTLQKSMYPTVRAFADEFGKWFDDFIKQL